MPWGCGWNFYFQSSFHSLFSIFYIKFFFSRTTVVLLDTTKEATLEWTRFPYGPQAQTPGWVEESFTNFGKGINWRSYVVCDVAYNNVNNWLWSPFIDRGPANRLYIEIHFTIRDCSLFPGLFTLFFPKGCFLIFSNNFQATHSLARKPSVSYFMSLMRQHENHHHGSQRVTNSLDA